MKLLEIIDERLYRKPLYEATELSLAIDEVIEYEGRNYRWLGQQFVLVRDDGRNGRPAPRAVQSALREMFSPADAVRNLDRTNISKAGNRWLVSNANGQIFQFENKRQADRAFELLRQDPRALDAEEFRARRLATYDQARTYTAAELEDAIKNRSRIVRMLQARPWMSRFFKILLTLGFGYELWASSIVVQDDIQNDETLTQAEKDQLRNTYAGIFYTEMMAVLIYILKTAAIVKRFIAMLRWAWAGAVAVATGATAAPTLGLSAVPGFIVWILGNVGLTVAAWYITRPETQRAMAEWIAGTLVGEIFEGIAWGTEGAFAVLDDVTDGALGSANLRRSLGWEDDAPATPEEAGDYYSSSEWAKIIFGEMFKTPDPIIVPFIPAARRREMMLERLEIDQDLLDSLSPTTESGEPTAPETEQPETTNEPTVAPASGATAPGDMGDGLRGPGTPSSRLDTKGETPEPSVNSGGPGFRPGQ